MLHIIYGMALILVNCSAIHADDGDAYEAKPAFFMLFSSEVHVGARRPVTIGACLVDV
jgi:hypothetical protein